VNKSLEKEAEKTLPEFSHEDDQRQHKKESDELHPEKQERNQTANV